MAVVSWGGIRKREIPSNYADFIQRGDMYPLIRARDAF